MTPYEIRLDILKLAKSILSEKIEHETREILLKQENGLCLANEFVIPKSYTEKDVISMATSLNNFVSYGDENSMSTRSLRKPSNE